MALYKGTTKIKSIYKGTTKITKVYKGATLVFSSARLPSAFQEVEYIGSKIERKQYIDTGISLSENVGCFLEVQFNSYTNQQALGVLEAGVGRFAPYFMDSDNLIKTAINLQNQMIILTQTNVLDRHTFEYNTNNKDIKFDGVSKGTVGSIGSTTNMIYLFRRNYSANPLGADMKLYSCKLYNNGALVRDFVPCYRRADNEIGLYDLVNGVFYTNAGTGSFTIGGNV